MAMQWKNRWRHCLKTDRIRLNLLELYLTSATGVLLRCFTFTHQANDQNSTICTQLLRSNGLQANRERNALPPLSLPYPGESSPCHRGLRKYSLLLGKKIYISHPLGSIFSCRVTPRLFSLGKSAKKALCITGFAFFTGPLPNKIKSPVAFAKQGLFASVKASALTKTSTPKYSHI